MKKEGLIIIGIFLISFVGASFNIGNSSHSIDEYYGKGDFIIGWTNLSLSEEPISSPFEDGRGNSINLIDLLRLNENSLLGINYNCVPVDCKSDYDATNGENLKTFNLGSKDSKIIGLSLNGEIEEITSINFTVNSDAGPHCRNQIKIDLLNDGSIDKANSKIGVGSCSHLKSYGCFDESKPTQNYNNQNQHICQRIRLTESPGFDLGVNIVNVSGLAKGEIKMGLHKATEPNEWEEVDGSNCVLPGFEGEQEIFCNISLLVTKSEDYYVCLSSENAESYQVKGYDDSINGCGAYGSPSSTPVERNSYKIFAEGKKFNSVGTLNLGGISGKVYDYLDDRYEKVNSDYINCTNGCVIPINFISDSNQQISLSNLKINYKEFGSAPTTETKFYDLTETPSKINMGFQKVYLDKGNFSVPNNYGNYTFDLNLNGNDVFRQRVVVGSLPTITSITPKTTIAALPTTFSALVSSSKNRSIEYKWSFGDGTLDKTTSVNNVTHTYNVTGEYSLKVTATDKEGRVSYMEAKINVGSPQKVTNESIQKMQRDLEKIESQIEGYSPFIQESLKNVLDFNFLEDSVAQLQRDYRTADLEEDYINLMKRILELDVPESVRETKVANSLPFVFSKEKINLDVLKEVGGDSYDPSIESKYVDAIISWNQKNLDSEIVFFKEISARYPEQERPVLRAFKLEVNEKENVGVGEDSFFIIKNIDDLKFKENYKQKESSGYTYIDIKLKELAIEFSTTEDVTFQTLPGFISPRLSRLELAKDIDDGEKEPFKWGLFALVIIFLIIVGIVIYIALQQWYKTKYEAHLFKNRNNLLNLFTYIENSKKRGLTNKQIISKLKKAGWDNEQINYSMRKYLGKRTGMFEIPLGKIGKRSKNNGQKVQQAIRNPFTNDIGKRKNFEGKFYGDRSSQK